MRHCCWNWWRLCIWALLNCNPLGFMIWLGVVCSSFSAINLATSKRSPCTPWGRTDLKYVRVGNALVSRSVLLILLCYALGGCWLLEQPGSSVLPWHPRFEYLRFCGLYHWSACWWQRHYGGLTPKRHKAWSNSPAVALLNRGVLTKKQREACKVQTTNKKWKDGKWAFSGNRHSKRTQSYPIPFGLRILRLLPKLLQQVWSYKLSDAAASADAPKLFSSTLWGDQWQEASLLEVAIYLRGSIHLRASPRWKETFPTTFPLVWIRVPDQKRRCLDKNVVKIC